MTEFKDMAVKPGGAGDASGDGPGPGRKQKGKSRGWKVFFLSCFLCTAAHHGQVVGIVEEGQGEHRQTRIQSTNDHNTSQNLNSKKDTKAKTQKEAKKKKHTQDEKQGKSVAWHLRLLGKRAAPTTRDIWMVKERMGENERLGQRQESSKRAQACLEAFFQLQERERDRLAVRCKIEKSRKVVEANEMWNALPLRADDVTRSVTFRAPSPFQAWPSNGRILSQKELEWRQTLDEVRKAQMENRMAKVVQEDKPGWWWGGSSIDWRKDLSTLFTGCIIFLFAWFCATALRT